MFLDDDEHMEGEVDNFNVIYSDVITFIAALFILLFSLTYSDSTGSSSLEVLSLSKKEKQEKQEKKVEKQTEIDDLLEKQLSQFITTTVVQQRVRIQLNDPVLFKKNSTLLNKRSKMILKHLSELLAQIDSRIIIEGESSKSEGSNNMDLSYRRAKSVFNYLVSSNLVPADKLIIQNQHKGPDKLLPAYMKQRVQFYVLRVKKT